MVHTSVTFRTSNEQWQKIHDAAVEVEKKNIIPAEDTHVLIEGGGYNGIWLETQPMGGEMYATHNMETALANQKFFMDHIREDGRIPSVIRFRDGQIQQKMFSHFQGYCFPYHALNLYYLNGRDREYLAQLYDVLERFDNYLWKTRDSDGDGCLETWCQWDTGEDNCTRFFGGPEAWGSDEAPYGQKKLPYESMVIMSYSVDGRQTLSEIAAILYPDSDLTKQWADKAQAVRDKIRAYLWVDERSACFDRDCDNEIMPALIHNNLRCMYHGSFDTYMAKRFVNKHLLNPEEFWTPMPLPSIAANDPLFYSNSNNNWSGQPEGLTYQRAIRALENYGMYDIIPKLGKKLCEAIALSGENIRFTQQFDPYTMEPSPYGNGCYGPTALAFMEYTTRMYGLKMIRDSIIWTGIADDTEEAEFIFEHGDYTYRFHMHGGIFEGWINGKKKFDSPRGTRVVTNPIGDITDISMI